MVLVSGRVLRIMLSLWYVYVARYVYSFLVYSVCSAVECPAVPLPPLQLTKAYGTSIQSSYKFKARIMSTEYS